MIEPWEKVASDYLGDFRIFRIRQDTSVSPRTGQTHRFFVLESPDWVNVIPLTPEGNVIMIRQFRHGTEDVTLEVPGGMVDADDGDPAVSAGRELREETGYAADAIVHLGSVAPNPAFLNNRCHSYLALDVRPVAEVALDGAEDIAFEEIPLAAIPDLIRSGAITHSLTITAFYYLDLYQEKRLTQSSQRTQRAQRDSGYGEEVTNEVGKNLTQRSQRTQSTQRDSELDGWILGQSETRASKPDVASQASPGQAGQLHENKIAEQIVDAAFHIHRTLGPGLLESAYEALLAHDLIQRGFKVARQVMLPLQYGEVRVDAGYRIDLLIEDKVIIELKSVDVLAPVHQKQLLTYLKLADKRLGLLINFGDAIFKHAVKRVVNGL